MVVCNNSIYPMAPASCPVTPTAIQPYPPGVIGSFGSVPGVPYNQRYPPATFLPNGQILTQAVPYVSGLPPPLIRCNQPTLSSQSTPSSTDSSPEGSVSNVITSNVIAPNIGIFTSNLVPCTTTNILPMTNGMTQFVPFSQGLPPVVSYSAKLGCNQTTSSPVVQCNQGIYTCSQPTVVPCTQRVVNGTSVLQCTPGLCQLTPATVLPAGAVEMCPIPAASVIPNSTEIYPVTPPLSLPPNVYSATPAPSWKQSYGMEQVWQHEFRSLFNNFSPHFWILFPVISKPNGMWNSNVDSAKVRFCCQDCGHGWTSMKGRVAFWFVFNHITGEGIVCLKLYGQQCDRCKTGNYEPAMWYPEEVMKVLVNIYNKVGEVYYGFDDAPYHKNRRAGKPRTPHNSELCQACKDGVCAERR